MTPPDRPDPADLLAHAAGLEALARRLVGATGAEDLVQETWLAALARPPRAAGPLGPWLRTVLRRLARDRVRGDASRRARQEAVSRMESEGDTHELVARAELHELLLRGVLDLEEPYRGVLLLRYFEGLSPAEIAERRGVPASTVRTQIERALARVRERLDARPGGRGAWHGLVVAALGTAVLTRGGTASAMGAGSAAAVAITGGTMAAKVAVVAAAGAAMLGAIVWTGVATREHPAERPPEAAAPAERDARIVTTAEPDVREAASSRPAGDARQALAAAPEVAAPAVEAAPEAPPSVRLRARIVDRDGRGIAGARLALVEPRSSFAEALADAWGGAELEAALESTERTHGVWEASAAGHATQRAQLVLERGATVALGTIELGPGGAVEGVVRLADGRPAPDATVVAVHPVRDPGLPNESIFFATRTEDRQIRTDADGRFHIDGVAVGPMRVWARDEDRDWCRSEVVEVGPEGEGAAVADIVLTDSDTSRIRGRVLDPDGRPVPNAVVHVLIESSDFTMVTAAVADETGTFEFSVQRALPHHLTARHPQGEYGEVSVRDVEPGTRDIVLRLVPLRTATLRVTDPAGRPVASYAVEVMQSGRSHVQTLYHLPEAARPDGVTDLRVPAVTFDLAVEARGHERVLRKGLVPEQIGDTLELVLATVPGVRGRVVHGDQPVAGARVELLRAVSNTQVLTADGLRSFVQQPPSAWVETDADGTFRLDLRENGSWFLVARKEGFADALMGPVALEAARGAEDVELALSGGGAIEGRVLAPPGADPEGTVVAFNDGHGSPKSVRAGPGGAYRVENLPPGRWQVRHLEAEIMPYSRSTSIRTVTVPFEWDCVVSDGETTRFDLDLTERVKLELEGELVAPGLSLAGWVASLEVSTGFESRSVVATTLDEAGRFRLEAPAAGYRLVLAGPCGEAAHLAISDNVTLAPGSERWRREFATGRAAGRIDVQRFSEHVRASTTLGPDQLRADVTVRAGADGAFGPLVLPVGELVVSPRTRDGSPADPQWRKFRIEADQTTEIDLR